MRYTYLLWSATFSLNRYCTYLANHYKWNFFSSQSLLLVNHYFAKEFKDQESINDLKERSAQFYSQHTCVVPDNTLPVLALEGTVWTGERLLASDRYDCLYPGGEVPLHHVVLQNGREILTTSKTTFKLDVEQCKPKQNPVS